MTAEDEAFIDGIDDAEYERLSEAFNSAYAKYRSDRTNPNLGDYGAWLASVRTMFAFMEEFWDSKGGTDE